MTSRVVLATRNAGKVREMQSLLAPLGWTVLNQADLDIPSAPEDGLTFLENALAKARHACLLSGLPAIADDSGLVVDALGGAPGIQSARFAGENADDDANNRHLLQALGSGLSRRAHFYCVLVYLEHARHPAPTVAVGRWSGHLRTTPAGSGGFGYDPLFQPDGLTCTSAELTATEKNTLSHRGQACRMLLDMLEKAVNPPLSLYVHFPWCVRKCPYCDFNSHPLKDGLPEQQYLSFLLADLETEWSHAGQRPFETVFFGGGTPSLFSPDTFAALLSTLGHAPHEITLEANPGTTEHRDLGACRQAGINRLSLGAQSFDDDMLTRLGRIHKAADTTRSFARARDGGFDNINLDIMYGLPGQTVDGALDDLRHAIALGVEHISWYELTLEPRTVFHRQPPVLPDEDILLTIETEGRALLTDAGYERYEVSAWAHPGRRCAHNLNYWHYGDYLGVGAGAHGKLTQGAVVTRSAKASQPRLYMTADRIDTYAAVPAERIPGEFFLNVLRTVDGLEFGAFELRTGLPWSAVAERWNHGVAAGLLRSNRIATTPMGFRYLDSVLQPFL